MVERGVIKFFLAHKGWGAVTVASLPEGVDIWFHHTAAPGTWEWFEPGDPVEVEFQQIPQNSFQFKASSVRRVPG